MEDSNTALREAAEQVDQAATEALKPLKEKVDKLTGVLRGELGDKIERAMASFENAASPKVISMTKGVDASEISETITLSIVQTAHELRAVLVETVDGGLYADIAALAIYDLDRLAEIFNPQLLEA